MKIRKFVAKSMPEALLLVREELGEEAVILNTRQTGRNSRFNPDDEACVEVIAGFDDLYSELPAGASDDGATRKKHNQVRVGTESRRGQVAYRELAKLANRADSQGALRHRPIQLADGPMGMGGALEQAAEDLQPGFQAEGRRLQVAPAHESLRSDSPDLQSPTPRNVDADSELRLQLAALQETVNRIDQRTPAGIVLPAEVRRIDDRMRNMGLGKELSLQVVQGVLQALDREELQDRSRVASRAVAELVDSFPSYREIIKVGRRQKVVAFVGASGAGKTAATAKIAAGFAMRRRDRIVMITTDDKRVGAMDQAQAFAEIIGIPLEIAYDAEETRAIVERNGSAQLILIDTPGCGPHDHQAWDRQREILQAAGVNEVQVVLDALTSLDHMLDVVDATAILPNRRLLFTKLDEVVRRGAVLSVAQRSQIPVSYVLTGPQVPGAIEAGDLEKLAAEMMGVAKSVNETVSNSMVSPQAMSA